MISLHRKQFPSSKAELAQALDEAAHRLVPKNGQIVDLQSRVFPYIDRIAVNLDGTEFNCSPPPPPKLQGDAAPAFDVAVLALSAREICICGVPVNARLEAHDLNLYKGHDENGDAMLAVRRLRDGTLSISVGQLDLEHAIEKIAQKKGRGLTIDQVRLAMRARGLRSVAIDIRIQLRKLLFRARIDVSGQIEIDESFVVKLANLKCKSDGGIGSIACTALEPAFRQLENSAFSLSSIPLGDVQVRDIRVAVGDTLEITVDFGTPSTA